MRHLLKALCFWVYLIPSGYSAEPPYIKAIPPLVRVPGEGVSFVIPNEQGWMFFDPDGKGATIAKIGQSEAETYTISLDIYDQDSQVSEQEFRQFYEAQKQRELDGPRYISRVAEDEVDKSKSHPWVGFYYLVEDHEARNMPSDQEFLLLETMGYLAINPENPGVILRVAYSYRYIPGHEDSNFREKAEWVLDHTEFYEP